MKKNVITSYVFILHVHVTCTCIMNIFYHFSYKISVLSYIKSIVLSHYENTPMQDTAIFEACKNYNCQMIFFYIFLIFAQNIDCGYTLEPPH